MGGQRQTLFARRTSKKNLGGRERANDTQVTCFMHGGQFLLYNKRGVMH